MSVSSALHQTASRLSGRHDASSHTTSLPLSEGGRTPPASQQSSVLSVPPFLPQSSDPPPKAARSQVLSEPATNVLRQVLAADPPHASGPKRTALESAAKLLAPGFVDTYERLTQALSDLERASTNDHVSLHKVLGLLHGYMGLQPFKLGSSGFSDAFDTKVLPRLTAAVSSFLNELHAPPVSECSSAVSLALAGDCLLCLVNMSACDGHMVKMMLRHGVAAVMVRVLMSQVPRNLLENAAWVLGKP
jgi:hypothetical protein